MNAASQPTDNDQRKTNNGRLDGKEVSHGAHGEHSVLENLLVFFLFWYILYLMKIYELIWPHDRIEHISCHGVLPEEVEQICFGEAFIQRAKSHGENHE